MTVIKIKCTCYAISAIFCNFFTSRSKVCFAIITGTYLKNYNNFNNYN